VDDGLGELGVGDGLPVEVGEGEPDETVGDGLGEFVPVLPGLGDDDALPACLPVRAAGVLECEG